MATTEQQRRTGWHGHKKRGQFKETWRRLRRNKMAVLGLTVVILHWYLMSIFADVLIDYDTVVIKTEYPDPSPGPQRRPLVRNGRNGP